MKAALRLLKTVIRPTAPEAPRYFVASPFKTATTTVGAALIKLGAGKNEMTFRRGVIAANRRTIKTLNRGIPDDMTARDWIASHGAQARVDMGDMIPLMQPYDVFSDAPFGHSHIHPFAFKAIYPNARFIWVNRPVEDWIASARAWEEAHPETYPRHVEWETDPKARRRKLRRTWKRRYGWFSRLAADYPDDCLEIDITDLNKWDALAGFCNLPAPDGAPDARNVSRGAADN